MTQDEIIRMAREAGIAHAAGIYMEHLERFAALVAAHEREACAKVCEQVGQDWNYHGIAAAIRARGSNGSR